MLQEQRVSGTQKKDQSDQSETGSKNQSGTGAAGALSGVQATINMLLAGNNPRPTPQQLDELKKALEKDPALKDFTLENMKVQSINGEYVVTAILTKDGEPKAAVAFRKQVSSPTAMYVGIDPGKRTNLLSSDFANSFCLALDKDDAFTKTAMQGLGNAPENHSLAMVDARTGLALSTDITKTRMNFDPSRPTIVLDGNQRVNASNKDPRLMELAVHDGGKAYFPEKAEFSTEKGARVVKVYYRVDGELREATFRGERSGEDMAAKIKKALEKSADQREAGIGAAAGLIHHGKTPPP